VRKEILVNFDPLKTEATITIQFKVKKEKYDKEEENLIKNTGNPWFTFKRIIPVDTTKELDNGALENLIMDNMIIDELHEVKFA
jgi:hypothetical protein